MKEPAKATHCVAPVRRLEPLDRPVVIRARLPGRRARFGRRTNPRSEGGAVAPGVKRKSAGSIRSVLAKVDDPGALSRSPQPKAYPGLEEQVMRHA
jgi:hypothetical protein